MMPLRPTQTAADEAAFVERFARLLEREGGPRIAGRIAALLLLTPEALFAGGDRAARLEWMRRLGAVAAEGARSQAAQHPVVRERLRALSRLQAFALRNTERALRQVRGAGRARA